MTIIGVMWQLNPEGIFAIRSYKEDKDYESLADEYWQDFNKRFGDIFDDYEEVKDFWSEYDEEKVCYKTIIELEREF